MQKSPLSRLRPGCNAWRGRLLIHPQRNRPLRRDAPDKLFRNDLPIAEPADAEDDLVLDIIAGCRGLRDVFRGDE
jgi:hypothetical protein